MKYLLLAGSLLMTGCAQSLVGAASFASSDLSLAEFNFLRNINHVAGRIADCNAEGETNHDLSLALYRINMDSDTVFLEDNLIGQGFSMIFDPGCQTWTENLTQWEQTGELGLIGGSTPDPKWNELNFATLN